MVSDNIAIAKDIYDVMLNNKEVSMTLRSLEQTKISMFIRYNTLNKFNYDVLSINALQNVDEDNDDYCEMPKEIYERACLLITSLIADMQIDLNYKTIEVAWSYDTKDDEFTIMDCSVKRELHRGGSLKMA